MKQMLLILVGIVFLNMTPLAHSATPNKKEKRRAQYQATLDLVKGGCFLFEAQRAFPQGGASIDLTTNYGFLSVTDSLATAHLPFFGRAYHVDYGEPGGIRFSGVVNELSVVEKPNKLRILYSFEVKDRDRYRIMLDIGYDGDTSLTVTSNNRESIRYSGRIEPCEEEDDSR
ncbi:DUF4251 domain-containing protein [Thermophagus sp. OGC60D27]|uniref:DUF4251 domain-containing protein n=1 Tax=Thermophagus sp. OGC60D27 TaxID=3458415 RepID=UPI0040379080